MIRQRAEIYRPKSAGPDCSRRRQDRLHQASIILGQRNLRNLQRVVPPLSAKVRTRSGSPPIWQRVCKARDRRLFRAMGGLRSNWQAM